MADKSKIVAENVPGRYYVDEECILCGDCVERAPDNFAMGDQYAYVQKQPEGADEEEQCQDATECCPVEAIGDDGE